jgi:hypothetical protein
MAHKLAVVSAALVTFRKILAKIAPFLLYGLQILDLPQKMSEP